MDIEDKYIAKGKRTASRIIGNEAVAVLRRKTAGDNVRVVTLNETGTELWDTLGNGRVKVKTALEKVAEKFEAKYEDHKAGFLGYVEKLVQQELLDVSEE